MTFQKYPASPFSLYITQITNHISLRIRYHFGERSHVSKEKSNFSDEKQQAAAWQLSKCPTRMNKFDANTQDQGLLLLSTIKKGINTI